VEDKESEVRVMTSAEKNFYDGVTIEGEGDSFRASGGQGYSEEKPRFYRVYSAPSSRKTTFLTLLFGDGTKSRLLRYALLVAGVAMGVAFLSFIFPLLITLVGLALAVWLLRSIFG